ncbi:acetate/propionate family kinase [Planctomyces sp. SH-PL14]|uniref:acetate/propionate family kinase n=1 Tax=Planctomyces sp. SH-PL14 TaxID=1632864 RepID=UPI00078E4AAD|nr:acetate/propionate family kinase [Planctomyces sp. SH-PL14]AMV20340.1 Acetate kinase [Planctomyces sp. SH-PL14]
MNVLLFNAGSSSLKCSLMASGTGAVLAHAVADWAGAKDGGQPRYTFGRGSDAPTSQSVDWHGYAAAADAFLRDLRKSGTLAGLHEIGAAGHRIVHGGTFREAVRITADVRHQIEDLIDLAPLHNPPGLETLRAAEAALPGIPHIASFDTAFHATLPRRAYTYAVPAAWARDWGIRRFGFHGLSHAYAARRAAEMLQRPVESLKLVTCHLGHGCSAAAVDRGACVDTTMGYTPLDGLMMGTRSGSVDPGVLVYVQRHHGLSPQQVETALNRESGLLGVSELSSDMRRVLEAAHGGNEPARLALEIYSHRIRQAIGAFTATMGGLDAIVFTGGVGEHSADIRESVCANLACLGLALDPVRNANGGPDADLSAPGSRARTLVITAREDLSMLLDIERVLGTP